MSFTKLFEENNDVQFIHDRIDQKTASDVLAAIHKTGKRNLDDFMAMISPAALPFIEEIAQLSHEATIRRFGNTMQLYIPMYLSNECQNICTYCGFSMDNKIRRTTLTEPQIIREAEKIKSYGYDHILLLTGEANKIVGLNYFEKALTLLRPYFSHISMEVQPMEQDDYERLIELGLNTVLIYQETYNMERYKTFHLKGRKSNFNYRLETPDRLGKAGIHKIGLGFLTGLSDWKVDSYYVALHLQYLEKQYWRTKFSISFPRLRPAEGYKVSKKFMTDKELVQLICAYRLYNEHVELSLSTRESPVFRDHAIKIGITSISAGSKTNPGGYTNGHDSLEQFEISDERSPSEVAEMIRQQGYEPVWKDWDLAMS